jgi:hypothetical protein
VFQTFNSIFADRSGNAAMTYARSSVNERFSIGRVSRFAGSPFGFMGDMTTVKESDGINNNNRWGDYSAIVADPFQAGIRFWLHHEFRPAAGGWRTWVQEIELSDVLAAGAAAPPPDGRLAVAPSPTSGATAVRFTLDAPAQATLQVFAVSGRLVRRQELGALGARQHTVPWDGRDDRGAPVAAGVYLAKITAGGHEIGTGRIVVSR